MEIQPTWFRITLSSYLPCSWISCHLVLFLVTKWRKIELSKRYFFCVERQISKKFSLLTSLWWVISETIIRYPIMLKTKFGGNIVTSFTRQMPKSENQKKHTILRNGVFYIAANFQVNCIKTKKRWMKVSVFYVTYAHHVREKKTFIHSGIILTQEITSLAPLVNL